MNIVVEYVADGEEQRSRRVDEEQTKSRQRVDEEQMKSRRRVYEEQTPSRRVEEWKSRIVEQQKRKMKLRKKKEIPCAQIMQRMKGDRDDRCNI